MKEMDCKAYRERMVVKFSHDKIKDLLPDSMVEPLAASYICSNFILPLFCWIMRVNL